MQRVGRKVECLPGDDPNPVVQRQRGLDQVTSRGSQALDGECGRFEGSENRRALLFNGSCLARWWGGREVKRIRVGARRLGSRTRVGLDKEESAWSSAEFDPSARCLLSCKCRLSEHNSRADSEQ